MCNWLSLRAMIVDSPPSTDQLSTVRSWQEHSKFPILWWHDRSKTHNFRTTKLRRNDTVGAVSIHNMTTPQWLKEALKRETLRKGSFETDSCPHSASRAGKPQLSEVTEMHSSLMGSANQSELFEKNTLMGMYVKGGCMVDARRVFDNMRKHNVVSWNMMILGYAKHEEGVLALEMYAHMCQEGVQASDRTFVAALKACTSLGASQLGKQVDGKFVKIGCLEKGKVIHSRVLKSGFESNIFVGNALIDMYVKCGSMEDAQRVFEELPERTVVCWNTMILGHAQKEEGVLALELYARMQQEGTEPRVRTFVAALKACSSLVALEKGKQVDGKIVKIQCLEKGRAIHTQAVKGGCDSDMFVGNTLVDMYTKCGSMEDALHVFDKMPCRNVASWTAMILGYVQKDEGTMALELYGQMRQEGAKPDHRTFVGSLKACRSLAMLEEWTEIDGKTMKIGSLEKGRALHSQVVMNAFDSDVFVSSTLVDTYVKCGCMEDARHVFDRMPERNIVSWTAMILGHAQNAEGALALELYARMHQEGVQPSDRTFVAALKACTSLAALEDRKKVGGQLGYLEKGKSIHFDAVKGGFESNVFVANTLVDMYVKCGSMEDARHVFDKMPHHNAVSWTAMISGYAQNEEGALALELYVQMHQEGFQPIDRTFVSALKACSSLATEEGKQVNGKLVKTGCLEKGRVIHSQVVKSGFELDVFVGTILVSMYAKCGNMDDARHVFDKLPDRDVVSWTAMISGYAQKGQGVLALELYAWMHQEGVTPDHQTFVGALKACSILAVLDNGTEVYGKIGCLEKGRAIHSQAVKSGFESDVYVGTTLVDAYVKCESLEDARHVFDELPCRVVISWTAMILGYAQKEQGALALELYAWMLQEGVIPDHRTFVGAVKACCSLAALEEGKHVHGKFVKTRCLEKGRTIHFQIVKSAFESDLFVGTILVDMYAKCGSMDDARSVFDKLPYHDLVSWTAMISGYAEQEESEEALTLHAQMQQQGLSADGVTFVSILKACGNTAALEIGKELHAQICRTGLENMAIVTNTLIDMYAKCGSMVDAQQLFDVLHTRDFVTWNALIAGYARQGEHEQVLYLFDRMGQEGIQPNGVTFLSVLNVCSHVGLVDTGWKYFQAMSKQYGIYPTIEHCTCMIDLLGRIGQLESAVVMLEAMPFQPDVVSWVSVLGACQKWKNVEFGRRAFEHAVKLDEKNAAAYVLMSNIYAHAEMWEDHDKIKVMGRNAHVWKKPGQSWWTDIDGMVHTFVVGDRRHHQSGDIYAKLREFSVKMEVEGYVPDLDCVSRNIYDDEKEDALCGHSEKLAIACALINTPEGTPIRVVKNLRVCDDCHKATAYI